ncbi:hypothetical protein B9Z19DRAFT_1085605, partial [Tuber borchii]
MSAFFPSRSLLLVRLFVSFPLAYPQSAGPCSLSGACMPWLVSLAGHRLLAGWPQFPPYKRQKKFRTKLCPPVLV